MTDRYRVVFGESAQPADSAFYESLTSLDVEENADLPGAIELTFPVAPVGNPGREDLSVIGDDRFQPYSRIAVVVTPDNKSDACIFDGYVLSQAIHLNPGTTSSSVRVWGQDVSWLMNLEETVREFVERSDGQVANEIFGNYGFTPAEGNLSDDDSPAHDTLMQRSTDAQFLRERSRRVGKLFRVACASQPGQNIGYFMRPALEVAPVTSLVLNPPDQANVDALDISWDVARPTEAIAQALLTTEDPVDGGSAESGLRLLDSRSLADFVGDHAMQARLTTVADSSEALKQRADALLQEAWWFVRCEGEANLARLNAVLRVGEVVRVSGAGSVHSGNYLVWSVRHTITAESHRMKFVLVRNAVGAG